MKKLIVVAVILMMLGTQCSVIISVADGNFVGLLAGLPSIVIQRDGSVSPQTEIIKQVGDNYFLAENLSRNYVIVINCSNIVFDGQGNWINGSMQFFYGGVWQNYYSYGITVEGVNNVTIRNVGVCNFAKPCLSIDSSTDISVQKVQSDEIRLENAYHSSVSDSVSAIEIASGSDNIISKSNISLHTDASNNLIFENNIKVKYAYNNFRYPTISWGSINSWDNGSIGNYWTDYNGSGTYVIDENNVDHHPLGQPISISAQVTTPTPTAICSLSPTNPPHLEVIYYLLPMSIILATIVGLTILVFWKASKNH